MANPLSGPAAPIDAASDDGVPAPLDRHRGTVRPEWIDYNGHMNVAYYVLVFDHATDVLFDWLGLGEAYRRASEYSLFAVESHITYQRELAAGDPVAVSSQLLGYDGKRLHVFHRMRHAEAGFAAATIEIMALHVDLGRRRAAPFPAPACARLARLHAAHMGLSRPAEAGRAIAQTLTPPTG